MEKRFEETAKTFQNVGTIFDSVGQGLTKSVSVPLAAAGAASVKFASESQEAFQQYAAATGTATEEMGQYRDIINEVYKSNFGDSIGEVADGMAKVQQNMSGLDGSALQQVTEYGFALRDTFGLEIAESTRAADTLMKNFGVTAEEAFNLMTQGAQSGLDFSGELFDNIDEYSVQFQKLGLDAEDMFSIFANGAQNGAFNLDKIGDAVKEFSIRAIDGSDTTRAGFEALGMDADSMAAKFAAGGDTAKQAFDQTIQALASMEDPIAQNTAGVNLFGSMWEDLSPKVVTSLSTSSSAIDKTKNSMEDLVNVKYDTLTGALGGLWRTIQTDVLQPIGTMLIPYVEKAIDKVGELVDWWNNLGEGTQKNIVKFAMIATAIGPALIAIGKLSTGIGGFITSSAKVSGAIMKLTGGATGFKALGTVMTGPVGIGIAAIAAGAVLIYKNWNRISPIIQRVTNRFQSFIKNVSGLNTVISIFQSIVSFLQGTFGVVFNTVFTAAGNILVSWIDGAASYIDHFLGILEGILTFMEGVFTGNWEKIWTGLRDIVSNAFGTLADLVKIPINAVIGVVNAAISRINSIKFTLPSWLPGGLGGKGWQGLNIPTIPTLAKGTDDWEGGIVQVHEKGGEIIDLPKGSRVYPHDESVKMAKQDASRHISLTIAKLADQIIVREDADIDRIAEAIAEKLEKVQLNMA